MELLCGGLAKREAKPCARDEDRQIFRAQTVLYDARGARSPIDAARSKLFVALWRRRCAWVLPAKTQVSACQRFVRADARDRRSAGKIPKA
jgi:hypothetical protein